MPSTVRNAYQDGSEEISTFEHYEVLLHFCTQTASGRISERKKEDGNIYSRSDITPA